MSSTTSTTPRRELGFWMCTALVVGNTIGIGIFMMPAALAPYVAAKGSIAVDGVSLTVNGVAGARFHVNLIPHTLAATTLRRLAPGARVNLEVDLIARYVARYAESTK